MQKLYPCSKMHTSRKEVCTVKLVGEWCDTVLFKKGGRIIEEPGRWKKNVIIPLKAEELIAGFLKRQANWQGIMFHAVGFGNPDWDTNPVEPTGEEVKLVDECLRKTPSLQYLKEFTGTADSGTATEIVDADRTEEDGYFVNSMVRIIEGTNLGEERLVIAFSQSEHKITVKSPFSEPIDTTSKYEINMPWTGITNKVESMLQIGLGDSATNGAIREQALFGGDATELKDTGRMLNCIRHPKIIKDSSIGIVRKVRIKIEVS